MSSNDDQASTSATATATATTTTKVKMIVLVSNEGEKFEVEESIAVKESVTIKNSLLDSSSDDDSQPIVPLPNVNAPMLARIIEYWKACNKESYESMTSDEKKKWEEEFGKGMKKDEIFEMVLAANYLDCKALFTVTCQAIAGTIKGMMPEEVRDYFHIDNDFTPEEEAKVRAENHWAFN